MTTKIMRLVSMMEVISDVKDTIENGEITLKNPMALQFNPVKKELSFIPLTMNMKDDALKIKEVNILYMGEPVDQLRRDYEKAIENHRLKRSNLVMP